MINKLNLLRASATKGPWAQGRLLLTRAVMGLPEEAKQTLQEVESREVFVNFYNEDEGRSRKRIGVFESPEDAALVVGVVNESFTLFQELVKLNEALIDLVIEAFVEGKYDGPTWPEASTLSDLTVLTSKLDELKKGSTNE